MLESGCKWRAPRPTGPTESTGGTGADAGAARGFYTGFQARVPPAKECARSPCSVHSGHGREGARVSLFLGSCDQIMTLEDHQTPPDPFKS
ncbi:hypothetical protein THAOC_06131, partial [Thalassiosira oceanica]